MKGRFEVTSAELEGLKREAERRGLTLSNYMRFCVGLPALKRGRHNFAEAGNELRATPASQLGRDLVATIDRAMDAAHELSYVMED